MTEITKDPYMLDPKEADEEKNRMKTGFGGILCPAKNKYLFSDNKCSVCDAIKPLWNYPKDSQQYKTASAKQAKMSFYLPVVLKSNPEQWIILECGKNAGNEILDGIAKQGWNDVMNPHAGLGREISITKSAPSGYNVYAAKASLQKADWEVPQSTLESFPNMDTILELFKNGVLVEGMNFMKISSIKTGETLMFRLLPRGARNTIFKLGIGWLYKHYGNVTQDEVDGNTGVNLTIPDVAPQKSETSIPPWEAQKGAAAGGTAPKQMQTPITAPRERCFGLTNFFDESDSQCQSCKDFKGCGREILKGK
jgi:hypothetical protein